ncbi:hypothetical protein AALA36_10165 [Lachnospiraceae bacterium 66-29]
MKQEQLSDALNYLPDEMLEETEHVRSVTRQKRIWRKWMAAAACLVLVFCVNLLMIPQQFFKDGTKELPILTVHRESGRDTGSFACVEAYDASEIVNDNPWSEEAEISTLPVYRRQFIYDPDRDNYGYDFAKMEALLRDVAGRLGLDAEHLEVKERKGSYYFNAYLTAKDEGIEIEVGHNMTVDIEFKHKVSLPDQYRFTDHASYQEVAAAAVYLKEEYKELIGMENPQINITGGDYNDKLQQSYDLEFYDGSGDIKNKIVNYNFNRIVFYTSGKKLWLIRLFCPDLSEMVGEYPIITTEEAMDCLLRGDYISSVFYEVPGREYIKKTELVYKVEDYEEYYMPYYEFYVELPQEEQENGLKTYGIYQVPAVEEKYISYKGKANFN